MYRNTSKMHITMEIEAQPLKRFIKNFAEKHSFECQIGLTGK